MTAMVFKMRVAGTPEITNRTGQSPGHQAPDLDVFELGVLRHQDQVCLDGELRNDLCVRQPPAAHRDDVLAFESGCDQAAVELEREVLVEQEPQEASLTAGGVWAASR